MTRFATTPTRDVHGLVLYMRNHGESDRIVELLTAELGKICLIAKGARKSRRRFGGVLDLFAHLTAQVRVRQGLCILESADMIDMHYGVRANLEAFERATLLCECARSLTAERDEASAIYRALSQALERLSRGQIEASVAAYPVMLMAAGLMPDLGRCTRCLGVLTSGVRINFDDGIVSCFKCRGAGNKLSAHGLEVLRSGNCTDRAIAREVECLLLGWVEQHTGRSMRSLGVGIG